MCVISHGVGEWHRPIRSWRHKGFALYGLVYRVGLFWPSVFVLLRRLRFAVLGQAVILVLVISRGQSIIINQKRSWATQVELLRGNNPRRI